MQRGENYISPPPTPPPPPPPRSTCPPFNTTAGSTCQGLTATPSGEASVAACKQACCVNSDCYVYQYQVAGTNPNGHRCWTGRCTTPPGGKSTNWAFGIANGGPPPPPPPPDNGQQVQYVADVQQARCMSSCLNRTYNSWRDHPVNPAGVIAGSLGVWTLFDYGGEPGNWPIVSSSFGQWDLAGFAKSASYWCVAPTPVCRARVDTRE
jgi:hypothetical protein